MKTQYGKKAVALYETRMSAKYVVTTIVMYLFAAMIWYALGVLLAYTGMVTVSESDKRLLTRSAFTATAEEVAGPEQYKERALLMPTGKDSYIRRLKLIEDAKESIDYIVHDSFIDDGSEYFYTSLVVAADRGVNVRILVDGKLGRLSGRLRPLEKILQNHNYIKYYVFNEMNIFKPAESMVLLHDKVTVVDGDKMIVGGVNMGFGAYFGNYDMEVMITNSGKNGTAGDAERYFGELINSGFVKRKTEKSCDTNKKAEYIKRYNDYKNGEFDRVEVDYAEQGIAVDKVSYLHNDISGGKKSPKILEAILNLARESKQTTVVTPYALLEDSKIAEIKKIAEKNDKFTLITNSLYNTRNSAYAKYYFGRSDYLGGNIDVTEYQAERQLHAKMYTFDGRYSVIGSFNLDERSAHIDTESVVIIDSTEFTRAVDEYIQTQFVANSIKVGDDNRYVQSNVRAGKVSALKFMKYMLLSPVGLITVLL